jgi:hypothetical protein
MTWQIAKVLIAAVLISLSSWLAGRQPRLAGFLIALPISSMFALALFYFEYRDPARGAEFARSILAGVPLSLLFFVPFLFAGQLRWNFWWLYLSGIALLAVGFFIHRAIV